MAHSPQSTFTIPDGWVARGFVFEVAPTSPTQHAQITQHFGARRFAYNWTLDQVKANLEARAADPEVAPLAWNFYKLHKQWNQAKHEVAPWWPGCSKEAYASGIADLVQGLHNWKAARAAAVGAGGLASRGSSPAAATAAGCGSPPGRCGWRRTAATWWCR